MAAKKRKAARLYEWCGVGCYWQDANGKNHFAHKDTQFVVAGTYFRLLRAHEKLKAPQSDAVTSGGAADEG